MRIATTKRRTKYQTENRVRTRFRCLFTFAGLVRVSAFTRGFISESFPPNIVSIQSTTERRRSDRETIARSIDKLIIFRRRHSIISRLAQKAGRLSVRVVPFPGRKLLRAKRTTTRHETTDRGTRAFEIIEKNVTRSGIVLLEMRPKTKNATRNLRCVCARRVILSDSKIKPRLHRRNQTRCWRTARDGSEGRGLRTCLLPHSPLFLLKNYWYMHFSVILRIYQSWRNN